jgi:hypothetical protein
VGHPSRRQLGSKHGEGEHSCAAGAAVAVRNLVEVLLVSALFLRCSADEGQAMVDGKAGVVLHVERRQRQPFGQTAGGDPCVVDRGCPPATFTLGR